MPKSPETKIGLNNNLRKQFSYDVLAPALEDHGIKTDETATEELNRCKWQPKLYQKESFVLIGTNPEESKASMAIVITKDKKNRPQADIVDLSKEKPLIKYHFPSCLRD
jgi:DNA polymerase IIIc chi subunit